jgi:hypothetical protein
MRSVYPARDFFGRANTVLVGGVVSGRVQDRLGQFQRLNMEFTLWTAGAVAPDCSWHPREATDLVLNGWGQAGVVVSRHNRQEQSGRPPTDLCWTPIFTSPAASLCNV